MNLSRNKLGILLAVIAESLLVLWLVKTLNVADMWQYINVVLISGIWITGYTLSFVLPENRRSIGVICWTAAIIFFSIIGSCFSIVPRGEICAAYSQVREQIRNEEVRIHNVDSQK